MATITKLRVDLERKKLIITAHSSGRSLLPQSDKQYRFTSIYVDTTCTFNCKDSPSSKAYGEEIDDTDISKIETNSGTIDAFEHDGVHYGGDLIEYEIDLANMPTAHDYGDEIYFVWIEETQYERQVEAGTGIVTYKPVDFSYIQSYTYDEPSLYKILLNHIKINSEIICDADCSDVNFMLSWHGFEVSKELENYRKMLYYWELLHTITVKPRNCGCNG